MQNTPHSRKKKTGACAFQKNPTFNVVTVYEDRHMGRQAKETCDRLTRHLGDECQVTNSLWNFNILQDPIAKSFAARDAADADMIIIATREELELPSHVKTWIERWFGEKADHPSALVALLGGSEGGAFGVLPIRSFLQNIADECGMDFFPIHPAMA